MERHLFLSGPGAREAVRTALGSKLLTAGGFVTEETRGEDGSLLRACLLPAAAAGGAEGFEPRTYLDLQAPVPFHDNEVFRVEGVRLLREAVWYPFSVLDCCGGFELLIPQFREGLADYLSSDRPIVGVLPPRKESAALCRRLGLGERVEQNIARLWQALKADPDTHIADLGALHRKTSLRLLDRWVEEYAG